ncbi:hypothetical protein [Streptomyces sp. NPDC046759]|uniref:hypothetical protein n=1 Tax=Streptomyces sp. NPDC046759 TaxID=3155019 RepID=UPI0033CE2749
MPTTETFATTTFPGLQAYCLVDAGGRRRAFRCRWVPEAGEAAIRPEDDRLLPPQYLIGEIKQRVEQAPAARRLVFQPAAGPRTGPHAQPPPGTRGTAFRCDQGRDATADPMPVPARRRRRVR